MAKNIPIFQITDVAQVSSGRPIYTRGTTPQIVKSVDHSVAKLSEHMTNFVEGVQQMLSKGATVAGEFRIETVEVQAEIGLEGKVGFLGAGVAASGSSQIKIVFQRTK